jgi:hypothetical protein
MSGGHFSHSEWKLHDFADQVGDLARPEIYPESVVTKLKELEHNLRRCGEMFKLADYLACGDVGIENFLRRWAEEVSPPMAGSAALREESAEVLRKIRADKQPTRRGILLCGEMMGKILQLGWAKEDLDTFEIMFWITRDADGRLLNHPPNSPDQPSGIS